MYAAEGKSGDQLRRLQRLRTDSKERQAELMTTCFLLELGPNNSARPLKALILTRCDAMKVSSIINSFQTLTIRLSPPSTAMTRIVRSAGMKEMSCDTRNNVIPVRAPFDS